MYFDICKTAVLCYNDKSAVKRDKYMNLTLNQFETLVYIERHQNDKCTQRRLAKKLDLSLGVINKTLTELQDSEVIKTRGSSMYDVTSRATRYWSPIA